MFLNISFFLYKISGNIQVQIKIMLKRTQVYGIYNSLNGVLFNLPEKVDIEGSRWFINTKCASRLGQGE